jgi:hypothetical protein
MKAPHRWDVRYQVEIGTEERHVLDVSWDQVWGLMSIRVDGAEVVRRRHLVGLRRVRRYELSVGEREAHKVVVEKRKTLVGGGVRHQVIEVFVDGEKVDEARHLHQSGV